MTDSLQKIAGVIQPYLFENSFILTDLPEKELDLCREGFQTSFRKRGDVLFKQGAFPAGVYWLLAGKVKISQQTPGGQHQTLYIYSDGDLIAFRQTIAREANPVSAVLLEDSRVGFMPAGLFRDILEASPVFTRNVLTALAREFTVWMNRMTAIAQFEVRRRLILALLILHEQYRRSGGAPGLVTITRTELAEYVGASLETVVRALNVLKSNGLARIHGRSILLPDPVALLELLQREGGDV